MKSQNTFYSKLLILFLVVFIFNLNYLSAQEETTWPQFRGHNSSGHANENCKPPVEFGVDNNLLWKVELPVGHSSPCIWGDNIFLTGFIKDKKELQTICVERNSGKIKWKQSVFPEKIENYHAISNAAVATPTTDGERVYVYFGSYGILCYNMNGDLVWENPMPLSNVWYGASTSPVVAGELLIFSQDFKNNSYLLAFDKVNGEEAWKVLLPVVYEDHYNITSYSTPLVMNDQVVLHRVWEISGYSIKDGSRIWWLPTPTSGVSTPIFKQNTLYINSWSEFGENERLGDLPDFAQMLSENDSNGDSLISIDEIPKNMILFTRPGMDEYTFYIHQLFFKFDMDKSGLIDEKEWEKTTKWIISFYGKSGLMAINPSGNGELPVSQVLWKITEKVPEIPSAIYYENNVYMIKNGGNITCVNAENGDVLYCKRLGASGTYIASPIAANDKIYIPAGNGVITVIKAGDTLEILAKNDLDEKISATPAIIGNTLYVRTAGNLYAFEE